MRLAGAMGGQGRLLAGAVISAAIHGAAVAVALGSKPASVIHPTEQVVPLHIAMFASAPVEVAQRLSAPMPPSPTPADTPARAEPAPQTQPTVDAQPPKPLVAPKPKPKSKPKPKPKSIAKAKPPTQRHREVKPPRHEIASPPPMAAVAPRQNAKPSSKTTASKPSGSAARPAAAAKPAISSPSSKAAQRAYLAALQSAIAARQRYPAEARRSGRAGTVTVAFVIMSDGRITQLRIAKGSGVPALDAAALDALRRLGRFRPIPSAIGRTSLALRVPVRFDLRR